MTKEQVKNEKEIARRHKELEADMEGEVERVYNTESRVRFSGEDPLGSNILNNKGFGHRTIGAKTHGKVARPVAGSGYGDYTAERLHRVA